jgi:hypothetical protein
MGEHSNADGGPGQEPGRWRCHRGYKIADIAKELGCSPSQASDLIGEAIAAANEQMVDRVERYRRESCARLDG